MGVTYKRVSRVKRKQNFSCETRKIQRLRLKWDEIDMLQTVSEWWSFVSTIMNRPVP